MARWLVLLPLLALASATPIMSAKKPNIIVILTDDQDLLLNGTTMQPVLKEKVIDKGVWFDHGFANTPVCCPSRSSILTGKFVHNHGARNNSKIGGCASDDWYNGPEKDALPVHLERAGYFSLYAGKYLNNYGLGGRAKDVHTPPGWSEWFGLHGNSRYYNYTIQDNDKAVQHGDSYEHDYLTDVLARRLETFLDTALTKRKATGQPFFAMIGTPAAHASFTPAPQYEDTAAGLNAPRPPSYNKVFQDKHQTVRDLSPMSATQIEQSDRAYRQRLGTLRSVDDMIAKLYNKLEAADEDNDTYFFYTADHGFHLGEFAMGFDKRQLYETDTRVPYFVRGPGVLQGAVRHEPISHVDLAPTIIDIAAGGVPDNWDGRSFLALLNQNKATWNVDTLIQYYGEGSVESCGSGFIRYAGDVALADGSYIPAPCDGANNTYSCVRRATPDLSVNDIFCEFTCVDASHRPVPCPADQPEGYGEYYDLNTDPWQIENKAKSLSQPQRKVLSQRVNHLRNCVGQAGCQHK